MEFKFLQLQNCRALRTFSLIRVAIGKALFRFSVTRLVGQIRR